MQRAERVARPERQPGGHRGRLVADLAVPLGDPAGEQQGLEARVEVPRELHEGVAEQALRALGRSRATIGGFAGGRMAIGRVYSAAV